MVCKIKVYYSKAHLANSSRNLQLRLLSMFNNSVSFRRYPCWASGGNNYTSYWQKSCSIQPPKKLQPIRQYLLQLSWKKEKKNLA